MTATPTGITTTGDAVLTGVAALAADTAGDSEYATASAGPPRACVDIGRVLDLPAEALGTHLDAVLSGPRAADALCVLHESGVLAVVLPEVSALADFHLSCPVHHKDLWTHTLEVLARTPPDVDLRWVALMHDTGKVATRLVRGGEVSFLRHERIGAFYMRGVGARLALPAERIERISFVIEHHARVNAYESTWSDRAVRRLVRHAGDRLDDMLAFAGADYTTQRARLKARIVAALAELRARIASLAAEDAAALVLPSGLGHELMRRCGLQRGPEVGAHIAWLRARVVSGELPASAHPDVYVEALTARLAQKE